MNIRFAKYDQVTGKINSTGSCPPEDMDQQTVSEGEGIIPCASDVRSATHRFDMQTFTFYLKDN